MPDPTVGSRRARPRLWHHDYLHLRPLSRDLERSIATARRERSFRDVLDVGSGDSPYGEWLADDASLYVRLDCDASRRPTVVGVAEDLPFAADSFDAVLLTQVWGLWNEPRKAACEIVRVAKPGARLWLSGPAGYPYDSATAEHRLGAPDLRSLFEGLEIVEIVPQGGMLTLPFVVFNLTAREAVIAAERRVGVLAQLLRWPVLALIVISNLKGRFFELLAARGPLKRFLGYMHGRMPSNFLVVARKKPVTGAPGSSIT
jgi:SAM-dependent methyltransferase